jgi:hypothetical protein
MFHNHILRYNRSLEFGGRMKFRQAAGYVEAIRENQLYPAMTELDRNYILHQA